MVDQSAEVAGIAELSTFEETSWVIMYVGFFAFYMYTHFVALERQALFSPLLIDMKAWNFYVRYWKLPSNNADLHRDRKHDLVVTVCRRWCRR